MSAQLWMIVRADGSADFVCRDHKAEALREFREHGVTVTLAPVDATDEDCGWC